jgi:DNA polymerase-3 subunit delta'
MTDLITPRNNTKIFGHSAIEAALQHDLAMEKLAHGLIFAGGRGIGKATLAYRLARILLAGGDARITANSHADLLVVERLYDEKKEEFAGEISVEQAREIPQFLSLTAGEGAWRVVIIDSVDYMNNNAANAILKILEEPPQKTIMILISHNVGKLLPTIRSRCRLVNFAPLSKDDFSQAIRHVAPEIYGEELLALGVLSENSVGIALELRNTGAIILYNEALDLLASVPNFDNSALLRYCEQIGSGKKAHSNWQVFVRVALCILERVTKIAISAKIQPISEHEKDNLQKLSSLHSAEIWAEKWQQASAQFSLAQNLHLDYKQVALTFFHSIISVDEFNLT